MGVRGEDAGRGRGRSLSPCRFRSEAVFWVLQGPCPLHWVPELPPHSGPLLESPPSGSQLGARAERGHQELTGSPQRRGSGQTKRQLRSHEPVSAVPQSRGTSPPQEHVERGLSSEVGVSVSEGGCCRGQRGRAGVASVSCVWSTGTRTCKQRSVNINSTVFKQDSGWAGLFFFLLRMSHRFRSREVFSTRTFVTWASSLHVTAESL